MCTIRGKDIFSSKDACSQSSQFFLATERKTEEWKVLVFGGDILSCNQKREGRVYIGTSVNQRSK